MWLDDHRSTLLRHNGPSVIVASSVYGGPHLIASLRQKEQPLVWIELAQSDRDDPVAQGNKLVGAVKQAFGSAFLPTALPFSHVVKFLEANLVWLGPLRLALTGADYGPELAERILQLGSSAAVVVAFEQLPRDFELPPHGQVLDVQALRLSERQACELVNGRLEESETRTLLLETGGAYSSFLSVLHERLALPLPLRPSPDGPHLPPGYEIMVEPAKLLKVLAKSGRWIEALEIASAHLPHELPTVLRKAGHVFHEQGLHQRLWQLLYDLPEEVGKQELVLQWRLSAAARLGRIKEVTTVIEHHLRESEAPELRAMYAATLRSPEQRFTESKRAVQVSRSPLTLFQHGRLMPNLAKGAEVLHESVSLAEEKGHPYEVVRNAGTLAAQLIHLGRYREAVQWSDYALDFSERHQLSDGQRQLLLLNDRSYARLLLGDTAGLQQPLAEIEAQLEVAYPDLARLVCSTLGDYHLAVGKPEDALRYYRKNWETTPRHLMGKAALGMVRALIEAGELAAAEEIADRAWSLTSREAVTLQLPSRLAQGIVLSFTQPDQADTLLSSILESRSEHLPARYLAAASLYLARTTYAKGDIERTKNILADARPSLGELSVTGLRLLSGPQDAFRPVWQLLASETTPLDLRFLGNLEVRLHNKLLDIPPQWGEILAILAFESNGRGVTLERLLADLFGDGGRANSVKATLSKMRRILPISRHPYQFRLPYTSDVKEIMDYLKKGKIREALALYRGPLLPFSDAPAIRQTREVLEEALRSAVLASGDAEDLLELAQASRDDLDLWEQAKRALDKENTPNFLVKAHINQIKKDWS